MRHALFLTFILFFAGGAYAQDDPVAAILAEANDFCASFENGEFDAGEAVHEVDLDRSPPLDHVVDSAAFSCSSMASAYCGSGGCSIWTVVADETTEYQAEGWRLIDWDDLPILLIARDGGWCGGYGAQLCFEAVNWSGGDRLSVMPAE